MTEEEAFAALMQGNDKAIAAIGNCRHMRFALVIWCDCATGVLFSGSTDLDRGRVAKMLRESAGMLDTADPFNDVDVAGHA